MAGWWEGVGCDLDSIHRAPQPFPWDWSKICSFSTWRSFSLISHQTLCVQGQLLASMVGPPKVTLHQATCWPYTAPQFLLSKELFLSLSQGLTISLFSHPMQWERVSAINARGRTGPRNELRGVADIISTAPLPSSAHLLPALRP